MSMIWYIYLSLIIFPNVLITIYLWLREGRGIPFWKNLQVASIFLVSGIFIILLSAIEMKRVGIEKIENASDDVIKKILFDGFYVGLAILLAVAIFG